ncbi:MAG: hypothetical protein K2Y16_06520 [Burkholderiales bacterium]|nr:hypothetical protein [Burkholderiales bacterium]
MATIYDYGNGLVEGSWHSIRDVVRRQPKEKLRYYHDCWRKASRKYSGTFNVSWRRRHGVSDSENAVRICNYLSKYMSKQACTWGRGRLRLPTPPPSG